MDEIEFTDELTEHELVKLEEFDPRSEEEKRQDYERLDEVLAKLTPLEKKYCQIVTFQSTSKGEAMRLAGSKANHRNCQKLAWKMEQKPHVIEYLAHLQGVMVEEAGLQVQEIIDNARKAIEMAFANGKPRDAEPHNRLLAELGGFIKNSAAQSKTQVNIVNGPEALAGESVEGDYQKLQAILSSGATTTTN
jgi:hypothetical protein